VSYAADAPALSYLDDACSYASNEVAINWNAPLVYVAAALQSLTR
jgi:endoglucanase